MPAAAWGLLLVGLTSWPSPPVPPGVAGADKLVHAALYGVLAWLLLDALRPTGPASRRAFATLAVVAAVSAFGWVDEWHQQFIPGRSRDTRDWMADTTGALTAAAAAVALRRPSPRTPQPRP